LLPGQRPHWRSAAFALHAAVSDHYDFDRDELYFIVCGQQPALPCVDQPPLVPLLAAGSRLFGERGSRFTSSAAPGESATVLVACAIVRLLRGVGSSRAWPPDSRRSFSP
jgi:hypothetical protein